MNKTWYVYKIIQLGSVIYVGHTSNKRRRLLTHNFNFGGGCSLVVLYETINKDLALKLENDFIFHYKQNGEPLRNSSSQKNHKQFPCGVWVELYWINKIGGKQAVIKIAQNAVDKHIARLRKIQNKFILQNRK